MQAALQRDLHAVREERDEDMSLDAALVLMEDWTYRQVLLQVFERSTVLEEVAGSSPATT
jgi:hypothetical protein